MALEHPREPLEYAAAVEYTEKWMAANVLTDKERERGFTCTVYDYHDRDATKLIKRPWTGVRVSEVDFSTKGGGSAFMQVDMPWGMAVCGQVERCILALVEGWNDPVQVGDDGEEWGETEGEFWRLGHLIEEMNKP